MTGQKSCDTCERGNGPLVWWGSRPPFLHVMSVLTVATGTIAGTAPAQAARLTVRPHEMATATRTAGPAGWQTSTDTSFIIYVPQQCIGSRRCPLVISTNASKEYLEPIGDWYGMLVADMPDAADLSRAAGFSRSLQKILAEFAVDPDKIAIVGRCATGQQTVDYGAQNLDIFSRIAVGTQHYGDPPVRASEQSNEYFIAGGLLEQVSDFWGIRHVRDRGYPVKYTLQFRGHTHTYEEYDFIGHWLQESWAIPDPAKRPAPQSFGPPPLLTTEIMAKMTAFWTTFQHEPDSIRVTVRRSLVREVAMPVGTMQISTLMVDMPVLAARYPSVAAAFKAAKLTPKEHEAYRVALAEALAYNNALPVSQQFYHMSADSVRRALGLQPTSTVVKNAMFLTTHPDEATALEATDMWRTP